jgi:hypothetical protein
VCQGGEALGQALAPIGLTTSPSCYRHRDAPAAYHRPLPRPRRWPVKRLTDRWTNVCQDPAHRIPTVGGGHETEARTDEGTCRGRPSAAGSALADPSGRGGLAAGAGDHRRARRPPHGRSTPPDHCTTPEHRIACQKGCQGSSTLGKYWGFRASRGCQGPKIPRPSSPSCGSSLGAEDFEIAGEYVDHASGHTNGGARDPRPAPAAQPRRHDPRRQLSAAREAPLGPVEDRAVDGGRGQPASPPASPEPCRAPSRRAPASPAGSRGR